MYENSKDTEKGAVVFSYLALCLIYHSPLCGQSKVVIKIFVISVELVNSGLSVTLLQIRRHNDSLLLTATHVAFHKNNN